MKQLGEYLRLVRVGNLAFIALIQLLTAYFVLGYVLRGYALEKFMLMGSDVPVVYMVLLVVATVLIAAGGYVINDYFDIKIDRINRAKSLIVSRTVEKRSAMRLYQALTAGGVIAGLALAWSLRSLSMGLLFFWIPGLLWFYSASYKRQFMVGNLIVAFCAALVPLMVVMTQLAYLGIEFGVLMQEAPQVSYSCYVWGGGFALFAFLLTWVREVVKDMQDVEGDREMECRTMPIVWGERWSKVVVFVLIGLVLACLAYVVFVLLSHEGSSTVERYFLCGIVLPMAFVVYLTAKAQCRTDYKSVSGLLKFIMLVGMLYSVVNFFLV